MQKITDNNKDSTKAMTKPMQNETPETLHSPNCECDKCISSPEPEQVTKPQDNIELKRAFEDEMMQQGIKYVHGETTFKKITDEVWDFFLPHLKDDNKIRRDSFIEILEFLSGFGGFTDLGDGDMQNELVEEYL